MFARILWYNYVEYFENNIWSISYIRTKWKFIFNSIFLHIREIISSINFSTRIKKIRKRKNILSQLKCKQINFNHLFLSLKKIHISLLKLKRLRGFVFNQFSVGIEFQIHTSSKNNLYFLTKSIDLVVFVISRKKAARKK